MPSRERNIRVVINFVLRNFKAVRAQLGELRGLLRGIGTESRTMSNTTTRSLGEVSTATGKLTGETNKVTAAQTRQAGGLQRLATRMRQFGARTLTAISFVARFGLAFAIIGTVQTLTVGAVRAFIRFQAALKDLEAIAGRSAREVEGLGRAILRAAGNTRFLVGEIANASKELLRLGFSATGVEDSIESITRFAQATGEALTGAAQLVAKTLNSYNPVSYTHLTLPTILRV